MTIFEDDNFVVITRSSLKIVVLAKSKVVKVEKVEFKIIRRVNLFVLVIVLEYTSASHGFYFFL